MMDKTITGILEGKIFIYPTDTIYGIGCNALNKESVKRIKEIKKRERDKPFSVIAPSFEWIREHCIVDADLKKYLPGPYTLILKKKHKNFLNHVSETDSLGIRIPDSEFSKSVKEAEVPFITTSINLSGEPFAVRIKDVPEEIKNRVDIIIDRGELNGKPSKLIIKGKEVVR
ncbi:MAG TPA: threonylcarbamoyl-AMP synthase [Candidatus Pacearchaeota archaeon]|nr:threonylcarbamoyl-AMP synthase [Candidatus Pacearchaeota archaeon]